MGEWERQPQSDTPMRLREGSLGTREVVVNLWWEKAGLEAEWSWEVLGKSSAPSVETWGSCLALAGQREGAAG